jgi:hypothetical protein
LDHAVHTELSGRVRIDDRTVPRLGICSVLAPDLRIADKEELLLRETIIRFRQDMIGKIVHQSRVGQLNSTIVGRVFAQR